MDPLWGKKDVVSLGKQPNVSDIRSVDDVEL
jgi:hypothetical protein